MQPFPEGDGETAPQPGHNEVDSDQEFFQEQEDPTSPEGDSITSNARSLQRQAAMIEEKEYREAYLYVHRINPQKRRRTQVMDWCFVERERRQRMQRLSE